MASIKEMQELLKQAREAGEEKQIANMAYKLGDTYLEKGKLAQALPLLQEAHSLCEKLNNPNSQAIVALSLASLYLVQEEADKAEQAAKPAYDHFKGLDEPQGRVKGCLLMGDSKWSRGQYEQALQYYEEAQQVCQTGGDVIGKATFLDRQAKMYRFMENDQKALSLFQKSLQCWQQLDVPDREAMTLANLGDIHKQLGDISQAIVCHEQALSIYKGLKQANAVSTLEQELAALKNLPAEEDSSQT